MHFPTRLDPVLGDRYETTQLPQTDVFKTITKISEMAAFQKL